MLVLMESATAIFILGIFGLLFGSFAGAQVWRLRALQLKEDKALGEKVSDEEYTALKPLLSKVAKHDRSQCLSCHHQLTWYDLIPLISWLSTKGRCRYCRKSIGKFEPALELLTAGLFIALYLAWPMLYGISIISIEFGLWMVALVMLVILFAYDYKWFLLPDRITYPLAAVSLVIAIVRIIQSGDVIASAISTGGAILILSGLYLMLWLISKGRWIGFGDVKLGLVLGLLLGDWLLALLTLFLANLLGCVIVIPGMIRGKVTRKTHIPFGPFLIAGFVISLTIGSSIINWYLSFLSL